MSDELDAHYMLMNDIDALETKDWNEGKGFDPIGDYDREIDSIGFMGGLNGNGHTINELFINRVTENNVGLFGCIYEDGNVRDVFLNNANIKGAVSVGLFAGTIRTKFADIWIENCHSEGTVEGAARIGGFCGETYAFLGEIVINNCSSIANVSGNNAVGGFSGKNDGNGDSVNIRFCSSNCVVFGVDPGQKSIGGFSGYDQAAFGEVNIQQCISTGSVKGDDRAGGFIGSCLRITYINCASLCSVEGIGHIGGFVGKIVAINVPFPSLLMNCYSIGSVKGSFNVGGFCGIIEADEKDDIKYSYFDNETSGKEISDGGTGKTTAQMKTRSTFETWDFDNIWDIDPEINNGYPFLRCLPTVSVDELISSQIKKLEIYPNPARDQIQIVFEEESAIISLVEISDLSGRLILTSKTDRIDVSLLSSGIYWVSVESDGEIYSTKLIVEK
ncbi:MAG: T9SS type A sorting domain-containing protein [Candidatus Kapabacteria bacterium]|jgi:hypothetical protein|nr:T9SS type A sorting domain-containing protein [Candidatus Kapabacteria bacterium]